MVNHQSRNHLCLGVRDPVRGQVKMSIYLRWWIMRMLSVRINTVTHLTSLVIVLFWFFAGSRHHGMVSRAMSGRARSSEVPLKYKATQRITIFTNKVAKSWKCLSTNFVQNWHFWPTCFAQSSSAIASISSTYVVCKYSLRFCLISCNRWCRSRKMLLLAH